jgi:hypothetical protein
MVIIAEKEYHIEKKKYKGICLTRTKEQIKQTSPVRCKKLRAIFKKL